MHRRARARPPARSSGGASVAASSSRSSQVAPSTGSRMTQNSSSATASSRPRVGSWTSAHVKRSADVVELGRDQREPLTAHRLMRCTALPAAGEVAQPDGMCSPHVVLVAEVAQALESELSDRLEHPEPFGPVRRLAPSEQALVEQRGHRLEIGLQTSSAASSEHPPRKTASRAKRLRSSAVRRSYDQAMVAFRVAWRGSASRDAGRSRRAPRRCSSASGASSFVRAAASSTASGRWSNRSQSSSTASERWMSGRTARARVTKSSAASSAGSGGRSHLRLRTDTQGLAARHE